MQFEERRSMIANVHSQNRETEHLIMPDMKVKTPSLPMLSATPNVNYGSPEAMAITFAENRKAQMAARAMFELVHQFGDNLREGWKNVLDLLLHLLRSNLLPVKLLLLEDFVDAQGHVSLKERFKHRQLAPKKEESGLFSWLGFTSSSGSSDADPKKPTEEEKELCKLAANIIAECHPENLIPDSRYLASSALTELVNNIIQCSMAISPTQQHAAHLPHHHQQQKHENILHQQGGGRQQHESQGSQSQDDDSIVDLGPSAALLTAVDGQIDPPMAAAKNEELLKISADQMPDPIGQMSPPSNSQQADSGSRLPHHFAPQQATPTKLQIEEEEAMAFLLELMVNIVLENRDRLAQVWSLVRDHLRWLLTNFPQNDQLMERAVVSIIRIANRNLFRLVHGGGGAAAPQQISPHSSQIGQQGQKTAVIGIGTTKPSVMISKSVVIVVDEDEQQQQQEKHEVLSHNQPLPLDQSIQQKTAHCADEVLQFLGQQLLSLRPPQLFLFSRQIAFGLQILLRSNAANVHSTEHWAMFFTLLEAVGAASYQDDEGADGDIAFEKHWVLHSGTAATSNKKSQQSSKAVYVVQSEPEDIVATMGMPKGVLVDERGYCSDDPSSMSATATGMGPKTTMMREGDGGNENNIQSNAPSPPSPAQHPAGVYIAPPPPPRHPRAGVYKRGTIVLAPNLSRHDPAAFLKVVETLTFLARDAAHITPANFAQFTHCLRIMVEASMDGGKCAPVQLPSAGISHHSTASSTHHSPIHSSTTAAASKEFPILHENEKQQQPKVGKTTQTTLGAAESTGQEGDKISEQERLANCYMDASLQLLNICAQIHGLSANIYRDWAADDTAAGAGGNEEAAVGGQNAALKLANGCTELWANYWRPLLQSIARMACDCRRRVRAMALDALGAAFRVPALGELMEPMDWEDCFAEVLFPLLTRLLFSSPPISPMDPIGMEEARIRAIQLSCKILLGHLTRISRLDTFADLLRRLFGQMDQFLGESAACSDLLAEVIQESLKNTVLVCESFGIFQGPLAGLHGEMNERLEKLAKKHGAGGAGLKMPL